MSRVYVATALKYNTLKLNGELVEKDQRENLPAIYKGLPIYHLPTRFVDKDIQLVSEDKYREIQRTRKPQ